MKLRAGEITRYINTPANTTSVKKCESAPMHSAPMPTTVPKTSGVHRQFQKKWLGQTGIKVIGPSDLCDDDSLKQCRRSDDRVDHRRLLFGRARFAAQQNL